MTTASPAAALLATAPQIAAQLAADLVAGFEHRPAAGLAVDPVTPMMASVQKLIDAIPYYGDPAFLQAHRSALVNVAANKLPASTVEPQPMDYGFGWAASYTYTGSAASYQAAFFSSNPWTPVGSAAFAATNPVFFLDLAGIKYPLWSMYSVALVTDAIRTKVGVALDTAQLASSLSTLASAFRPAVTPSVAAVLEDGYTPTASVLGMIKSSNETAAALAELAASVESPAFIANSNEALAGGGTSADAVTWFLFNIWTLLHALGSADVGAVIAKAMAAGLEVPTEIQANSWWTGGYAAWFSPLSGSDLAAAAGANLTATMPQQEVFSAGSGYPSILPSPLPNGYALSFCQWGANADYKPPPSSCLGRGTLVLMADHSTCPIEEVRVDDMVMSSDGPRRVALIERPQQSTRALTRINGLEVWATDGHPFRSDDGPMRRCVEPWTLIDATPTMTGAGVGKLEPGSRLVGRRKLASGELEPIVVEVEQLERIDPTGAGDSGGEIDLDGDDRGDEVVYDLLLEDWERGDATYFVGGPELFVAVDAEAADPLHEPRATVGVLTAMDRALDLARTRVADPVNGLSELVNRLDVREWTSRAHAASKVASPGKIVRPPLPGPEYYMIDGDWEPHASALEVYLIRRFARAWRRTTALAAAGTTHLRSTRGGDGDAFALLISDVEILGDIAVPVDPEVRIEIEATDGDAVRRFEATVVVPSNDMRWHPRMDELVDLGPLSAEPLLRLFVHVNDELVGSCHIEPSLTTAPPEPSPLEHLLRASDGSVVGRVACVGAWLPSHNADVEEPPAPGRKAAMAAAVSLGLQAGDELVRLTDRHGSWLPPRTPVGATQ